jgi:hypothetical protein
MTLILDTGALVAVERGDPTVVAALDRERTAGRSPRTHGGVVAQVWRGGTGRQAWMARHLKGVEIVPLDEYLGKRAGVLLGRTSTSDVIDAAVVALAVAGDVILTSDARDLTPLAEASGGRIGIRPV